MIFKYLLIILVLLEERVIGKVFVKMLVIMKIILEFKE